MSETFNASPKRPVWNAGRAVGAKRALKPKQIWEIRFCLNQRRRLRDRALFDLAIYRLVPTYVQMPGALSNWFGKARKDRPLAQPISCDLAPMPFRRQRGAQGFQQRRQHLREGVGRIDDIKARAVV